MYQRIHLLNLGTLVILGLVITAGCSNTFWTPHYKAMAQPQPSPLQKQPSTPAGGALTYTDSVCAIRMQYPSSWTRVQPEAYNILFHVPKTSIGLSVDTGLLQDPSLDSHVRAIINYLKQDLQERFQLIKSGTTTLAGNPAHVIEHRYKEGFPEAPMSIVIYHTMNIFTIKGDKVYTLTYSAPEAEYPRHLSTINSMISTLVIGNPTRACQPPGYFPDLIVTKPVIEPDIGTPPAGGASGSGGGGGLGTGTETDKFGAGATGGLGAAPTDQFGTGATGGLGTGTGTDEFGLSGTDEFSNVTGFDPGCKSITCG